MHKGEPEIKVGITFNQVTNIRAVHTGRQRKHILESAMFYVFATFGVTACGSGWQTQT